MRPLGLEVPPHVAEILRALPPGLKQAVKQALLAIRADPNIGTALQRDLAGYQRYRVRRFRVVYQFDRARKVVRVVAVGHRRSIYEELAESVAQRRDRKIRDR